MMLAVAEPSFAQISAHGHISACDQNKALPDYANDYMGSQLTRYFFGYSDLKSTPRSSLAMYCISEYSAMTRP